MLTCCDLKFVLSIYPAIHSFIIIQSFDEEERGREREKMASTSRRINFRVCQFSKTNWTIWSVQIHWQIENLTVNLPVTLYTHTNAQLNRRRLMTWKICCSVVTVWQTVPKRTHTIMIFRLIHSFRFTSSMSERQRTLSFVSFF